MTLKLRGYDITSTSTKNNSTFNLTLIIFNTFIFIFTLAPIFALTTSINKLFKQFMKIYLEV